MSDSVKGTDYTVLQPGDTNVPVSLKLKAASASTTNDGSIPYGSSVHSSSWRSYGPTGALSSTMVVSSKLSSNVCTVFLTYSSNLLKGMHTLTAKVTVNLSGTTNMTRQYDLKRILVKDQK